MSWTRDILEKFIERSLVCGRLNQMIIKTGILKIVLTRSW
jgi:hypothetical protein